MRWSRSHTRRAWRRLHAATSASTYNGLGSPGPANGCPSTAPTEGSPCCRAYVAGHGCPIGDGRWDCVGDHWARTP